MQKDNQCYPVDKARRKMFVKDGRNLKTIPLTSAELLEHTFSAAYIAGHVWNNASGSSPNLPQPNLVRLGTYW